MDIREQLALGGALAQAMQACIEDANEPDADGNVEVNEVEMTFEIFGIKWKATIVPEGEAGKDD